MGTFYIHDFRIYQKDTGTYYIQFSRKQRRSLKTKDRAIAEGRARASVEQYFQKKITETRIGNNKLISEYLKEFLTRKAFSSRGSARGYITAVNTFIDVVGDKFINAVTSSDIEKFKSVKKNLTSASLNTYLVRLKALLEASVKDGVSKNRPDIKKLKSSKRLPVVLTRPDRESLLEHIKQTDFEFYKICRFALFTGCRRAEIISAMWENFTGSMLRVIGKGDKERAVPIVDQARAAMGERKGSGPIFWQAHPDTYSHRFKQYARACGLNHLNFHKMRHTAATSMLEEGVHIVVVQKILGHTDIATTQIYTHVMDKFMMEEMGKFGQMKSVS